jgi:hypothetical protein
VYFEERQTPRKAFSEEDCIRALLLVPATLLTTDFHTEGRDRIRARVTIVITDIYDRTHRLLPVGYIHGLGPGGDWYIEPSLEELDVAG